MARENLKTQQELPKRSSALNIRVLFIGGVLGLIWVILWIRAYQLQIVQQQDLKDIGLNQYFKEIQFDTRRGMILDRNQIPLAMSVDIGSVFAQPLIVEDKEAAAKKLSQILKMNPQEILAKLKKKRHFIWIRRHVSSEIETAVNNLRIEGVGILFEGKRYYPNNSLASQLIGFVNIDGQGLEGIELFFNPELKGKKLTFSVLKDARGRIVLSNGYIQTSLHEGNSLILTIDRTIQFIAEKELEIGVKEHGALRGMAIVVEPETGAILAMANYPGFNLNRREEYQSNRRKNGCILDLFEPGSTYKTILFAAALDADKVRPTDMIDCKMGHLKIGKYFIHDVHPVGTITAAEVLQKSSNIGASQIAKALGHERFYDYILRLGFGRPVKIEFPGSAKGIVRDYRKWADIGLANIAFGHGIAVTALQMVQAYSIIANNGIHVPLRLVERMISPSNQVIKDYTQDVIKNRVLKPTTGIILKKLLHNAIQPGGTGVKANIDGFDVGGKTGTAQKLDLIRGGYDKNKWMASFIGMVPLDRPRLLIVIVVDEPGGRAFGGVVAAPIFKNIAGQTLQYLGIKPTRESRQLTQIARANQAVSKNLKKLESKMRNNRNGSDWQVTKRQKNAGNLPQDFRDPGFEENSSLQVDPDKNPISPSAVMPNLLGLPTRTVYQRVSDINCKSRFIGGGFLVKQVPGPEAPLPDSGECEFYFSLNSNEKGDRLDLTGKGNGRPQVYQIGWDQATAICQKILSLKPKNTTQKPKRGRKPYVSSKKRPRYKWWGGVKMKLAKKVDN